MIPNYDGLRAASFKPRMHPNGFIQLDLTANQLIRLHVWPDQFIQTQKTRHPVHDHSFHMKSEILTGGITNLVYEWQESEFNPQYTLYRAKPTGSGQNTVLAPAAGPNTGYLRLLRLSCDTYLPGSNYSLTKRVLHDSIPHGLTATLMTKSLLSEYSPLVAVPKGIEPDNNYSRMDVDEDILWSFIKRALEKAAKE
jgi:hypothetical protein